MIEASTKAGKTLGCIIWIIEQALAGGGDGRNYWWVAPVATQADIAFTRMLRYLPQGAFTANRTTRTIVLLNGAIIWTKGADRPDTLYGDDVHAAIIDEASRFKSTAWEAVRSTLTATRGPMRIIGNVKGRRNWFYMLARRAEQGTPDMGYHKITAHDAVEAGVLAAEEIEAARQQLSDRAFRELYLAEPSDDEGNPFGGDTAIRACIAPLAGSRPYVWGVDLAKSVDWTVAIALDRAGYVCRFERWQSPWEETVARLLRLIGQTPTLIDSTGVGDPIVERLQRSRGTRVEGYKFTPGSKQQLMEGLAVAIQSKNITYPDGPIALELGQFEYEHTRSGVRYSAPEGFYDDCVCALALAVMHHSRAVPPLYISDELLRRSAMPGRPTL